MQSISRSKIQSLYPVDQQPLYIPPLQYVDWAVLDYFGWVQPSHHVGYVVAPLAGNNDLRGITLQRASSSKEKPRYEMCSWCNHVHPTNGTAMFSMKVRGSDDRKSFGNALCRNLDCSLRIRNLASDPPSYMNETINLANKVQRLQNSIYRWLYRSNCLYET
ncbi:MAG: FBP domain-containing protein [Pseudomonadales bacterium]|nr:FBP domain-containing protein [Pseudomonadales bacterium]